MSGQKPPPPPRSLEKDLAGFGKLVRGSHAGRTPAERLAAQQQAQEDSEKQ